MVLSVTLGLWSELIFYIKNYKQKFKFCVSLFVCLFCIWISVCPSTIFKKDCPFSTELIYVCQKSIDHTCVGLFVGCPFFPTGLFIYLYVTDILSQLLHLYKFLSGIIILSHLFKKIVFWKWWIFCIFMRILESTFQFLQKKPWNFDWDYIEFLD